MSLHNRHTLKYWAAQIRQGHGWKHVKGPRKAELSAAFDQAIQYVKPYYSDSEGGQSGRVDPTQNENVGRAYAACSAMHRAANHAAMDEDIRTGRRDAYLLSR